MLQNAFSKCQFSPFAGIDGSEMRLTVDWVYSSCPTQLLLRACCCSFLPHNRVFRYVLATLNVISSNLRSEIQKTANYEDYLFELMECCVDSLEQEKHILPEEKHCFFRVLLVSFLFSFFYFSFRCFCLRNCRMGWKAHPFGVQVHDR